ncbi:MAG: type II secretion system protein [Phycisphaerales bacterium]|nr:type II secretion system protein [Phycisphaerales bacterium]
MNRPDLSKHQSRSAFTLIELLVVISIMAVLIAITTMVGSAVINTGKKQATLGILESLDQTLAAYIDKNGDIPPALVEVPYGNLPASIQGDMPTDSYGIKLSAYFPSVDGSGRRNVSGDLQLINSVAYFIQASSDISEATELLNSIDTKYLKMFSPDEDVQPFLLTAFDAWDNPIRYVHPKFDGIIERTTRSVGDAGEPVNLVNPNKPFFVQGALPANATVRVQMKFVRRNRLTEADYGGPGAATQGGVNQQQLAEFDLYPDSDGGITIGNRPYFYSAGPDGDPSTIEDNIYTTTPQFADATTN